MTEKELIDKIAYVFYQKRVNGHIEGDEHTDFMHACRVFDHFSKPKDDTDWRWRLDDEDYEEFRELFKDRQIGG